MTDFIGKLYVHYKLICVLYNIVLIPEVVKTSITSSCYIETFDEYSKSQQYPLFDEEKDTAECFHLASDFLGRLYINKLLTLGKHK